MNDQQLSKYCNTCNPIEKERYPPMILRNYNIMDPNLNLRPRSGSSKKIIIDNINHKDNNILNLSYRNENFIPERSKSSQVHPKNGSNFNEIKQMNLPLKFESDEIYHTIVNFKNKEKEIFTPESSVLNFQTSNKKGNISSTKEVREEREINRFIKEKDTFKEKSFTQKYTNPSNINNIKKVENSSINRFFTNHNHNVNDNIIYNKRFQTITNSEMEEKLNIISALKGELNKSFQSLSSSNNNSFLSDNFGNDHTKMVAVMKEEKREKLRNNLKNYCTYKDSRIIKSGLNTSLPIYEKEVDKKAIKMHYQYLKKQIEENQIRDKIKYENEEYLKQKIIAAEIQKEKNEKIYKDKTIKSIQKLLNDNYDLDNHIKALRKVF